MIPKVIHYIWVGPNQMGRLQERCIESWKKYLPDYEIKFWNESNLPKGVMEHPYVVAMYEKKKWAFVSDYIRFWVLEKEGGIYLDTDTEVLKNFDDLLNNHAFVGKSKSGHTESSVIGVSSNNDFSKECLNFYDKDREFSTENTSPIVIDRVIKNNPNLEIKIYDSSYFHPCNEGEYCSSEILRKAYARHHWAESWVSFVAARRFLRRLRLMNLIKSIKS